MDCSRCSQDSDSTQVLERQPGVKAGPWICNPWALFRQGPCPPGCQASSLTALGSALCLQTSWPTGSPSSGHVPGPQVPTKLPQGSSPKPLAPRASGKCCCQTAFLRGHPRPAPPRVLAAVRWACPAHGKPSSPPLSPPPRAWPHGLSLHLQPGTAIPPRASFSSSAVTHAQSSPTGGKTPLTLVVISSFLLPSSSKPL